MVASKKKIAKKERSDAQKASSKKKSGRAKKNALSSDPSKKRKKSSVAQQHSPQEKKNKKATQSTHAESLQKKSQKKAAQQNTPSIPLIVALLAKETKPLSLVTLLKRAELPKKTLHIVEKILQNLIKQGLVCKEKGYTLHPLAPIVEGVLQIQRSGATFVTPRNTTAFTQDIFIPQNATLNAWHLDTVRVLITQPAKKEKKAEGIVLDVLSKNTKDLVGIYVRNLKRKVALLQSVNPAIPALFSVEITKSTPFKHDFLYRIKPLYEEKENIWKSEYVEELGHRTLPSTQEKVTKIHHDLPEAFSPQLLKEANALKDKPVAKRCDLTHLPFVTIDGETAKDFDDAICIQKTQKGYTVFIAIADVTAYVQPNSLLDQEAKFRSNSFYFPASVIPMLPEILSNDLCSLRPNEPKLALVLEVACSAKGKILSHKIHEALICSKARLTYTQVHNHCCSMDFSSFLGNTKTNSSIKQGFLPFTHGQFFIPHPTPSYIKETSTQSLHAVTDPEITSMVEKAYGFSLLLHKQRAEKKALFFTTTTPIFTQNHDIITNVTPAPHYYAHTMIEEYMLLANEIVAGILCKNSLPALYRVHPAPNGEKLEKLRTFMLFKFPEYSFPETEDPHFLHAVLECIRTCDTEYAFMHLTIRSMMQACYSPLVAEHYGLQSAMYCHFTSPIRRYADVLVHRAIKAFLHKDTTQLLEEDSLLAIADHINQQERKALDAEREIQKRLGVLFLQSHCEEVFNATIVGITQHALFVEFTTMAIQGTILLTNLEDDYYIVIEEQQTVRGKKNNICYTLGDTIAVKIIAASLERLEILCIPVSPKKTKKHKK